MIRNVDHLQFYRITYNTTKLDLRQDKSDKLGNICAWRGRGIGQLLMALQVLCDTRLCLEQPQMVF